MSDIYVDIRQENESIRELFNDKDFVSIDTLLDVIDELKYELDKKQETIDELTEGNKENNSVWEMFDLQYKEQRLREMKYMMSLAKKVMK